jgi:hypothetical protein
MEDQVGSATRPRYQDPQIANAAQTASRGVRVWSGFLLPPNVTIFKTEFTRWAQDKQRENSTKRDVFPRRGTALVPPLLWEQRRCGTVW